MFFAGERLYVSGILKENKLKDPGKLLKKSFETL